MLSTTGFGTSEQKFNTERQPFGAGNVANDGRKPVRERRKGMAKLLRVDKNGTKYWAESKCSKCGGKGYIDYYYYNQQGVCFECGGTGIKEHTWKEYTPEYAQKLADRRMAKAKKAAPEKNVKFFKKEGFSEDGKAWIVLGNTFEIKDALKEAGAKWNNLLGWHFDHETKFDTFEISVDDVMETDYAGVYMYTDYWAVLDFIKEQKAAHAPKTASEFVGEIGDKVEMRLTFTAYYTFETHYTYNGEVSYIYKFADENGNTIVWKTGKPMELKEGTEYTVKGTIKAHSEYKGDKQTVLTRCKITK